MHVDHVEAVVGVCQGLAVGHPEITLEATEFEVLLGQVDGRPAQVHAGDNGATGREPRQVDARAAADLQHLHPLEGGKVNQFWQVVQLVESVLVQVVEEAQGADLVFHDLQVVDAFVPVVGDGVLEFGVVSIGHMLSCSSLFSAYSAYSAVYSGGHKGPPLRIHHRFMWWP